MASAAALARRSRRSLTSAATRSAAWPGLATGAHPREETARGRAQAPGVVDGAVGVGDGGRLLQHAVGDRLVEVRPVALEQAAVQVDARDAVRARAEQNRPPVRGLRGGERLGEVPVVEAVERTGERTLPSHASAP